MSAGPTPLVFTGAEGNRLVADRFGAGLRTAILLHGGGQTRHSWDGTAERLAARGVSAIVVDQRGHGESEWVPSRHYAFADYAADAREIARRILDETGEKPIAVGASLGGIASLMAEGGEATGGGGGHFAALVLVDIVPRMDMGGVAKITGFMRERMAEGFATVEEAADAIAAYLPHRERPKSLDGLAKNLRRHEDGRFRWHWDPAFLSGPVPVGAGKETLLDRMHAACDRLALPVLLVRGQRSELVSEERAREFLDMVPHARTVDVSGAGHMVAGDRNDVFAGAVVDFLAAEGLAASADA